MTFSIVKQKIDLLASGEKLTHQDWEPNEYIFVNDKDELVMQDGVKVLFEFFDSKNFLTELKIFNPACHSLNDALAHFAATGRGFRRCLDAPNIKVWTKTDTGALQARERYCGLSVLFTEDDLSAKDYELL